MLPGRRDVRLPPWTGPETSLPPLLVGGTGRSGTTITGRLLGEHRDYYMIPFEVRFLSDRHGLGDLVAGRSSLAAFRRRLLEKWFHRDPGIGLHEITDERTIRAALRELGEGLRTDPRRAGERFVHRLFDPPALAAGARGWVEMTPGLARVADEVLSILPDARLVHIVRDGRDAACSVAPLPWGPSTIEAGLEWWADSLDQAYAGVAAAPPGRALTVRMEALLATDRNREYERLRAFAGLDDDPGMRAFFETQATADGAHIGRWRKDLTPERADAFDAQYRALAEPLAERWGYELLSGPGSAR
jgi:hypothetical protein